VDRSIKAIQDSLEQTARALLRYGAANPLSHAEHRKLEQFIFGLMNQKLTIEARVRKRGSGELEKVLRYIGRASEAVLKMDQRRKKEETEK
jgi:hypothetical protein